MKLSELARKKCIPCRGGSKPLSAEQTHSYISELRGWRETADGKSIETEFSFDTFANTMIFVNCVAHLAEEEGHHPDIYIYYNKVKLSLHTHAIRGLSLNDFILAAKIMEDCISAS